MAKITLRNISKKYTIKNRLVTALDGIDLSIDASTFTVLTGPSGSGKSTILQLISGIEQPTSGQIVIDDQVISALNSQQLSAFRRQKIGIVFQQFYLDPTLTLKQNIELPAMFSNLSHEERSKRTAELADIMGLQELLNHLPSELSGGQIQRAAVARAIYNKPSILIADEPTSSLDYDNVISVIKLFKHIQQTYGTTVIIATHDQAIAELANQTITIKDGRIGL